MQSPDGIKEFERDGLVLADGRKLVADTVVLATGYDNMRTSLRKILGDKVADGAKDVWDVDGEGELNAVRATRRTFSEDCKTDMRGRCGDRVDIPDSGIWAAIWLCVGFIRGFWLYRSRPLRRVSTTYEDAYWLCNERTKGFVVRSVCRIIGRN